MVAGACEPPAEARSEAAIAPDDEDPAHGPCTSGRSSNVAVWRTSSPNQGGTTLGMNEEGTRARPAPPGAVSAPAPRHPAPPPRPRLPASALAKPGVDDAEHEREAPAA